MTSSCTCAVCGHSVGLDTDHVEIDAEMLTRLERLADKVRSIQPDDTTGIADGQATLDDQEADS